MAETGNLGTIYYTVEADTSPLVNSTKPLDKSLDNTEKRFKKTDQSADKFDTRMKKVSSSVKEATKSGNGLATAYKAVGTALAAIGAARILKEITNSSLAFDAINSSLIVATGSTERASQEFNFLTKEANRLGLELESSAKAYSSLAAASRGTTLEGQASRDIFIAMSEAMTALGRDAYDTEGALTAVEQMISKGNVSAEELRGQLGERLPGAFQMAAKAMGVTTQELDKMLSNGEVTATQMLPRLATELRKTFSSEAERRANGLQAEINRFKTAIFQLMSSGNMDGLASAVRDFTSLVKDPNFQEGFGDFLSGVVTLAQWGGKAASGVASLGKAIGEGVARTLHGPLTNSREFIEGEISNIETQLELLDSEMEKSRVFRINPFRSDDSMQQEYSDLVNKLSNYKSQLQEIENIKTDSVELPAIEVTGSSGRQGNEAGTPVNEKALSLLKEYNDAIKMAELHGKDLAIAQAESRAIGFASPEELERIKQLAAELFEVQQKVSENAEMEAEAAQIKESLKSDQDRLNDTTTRYLELLRAGKLTQDEFTAATQKAAQELEDAGKKAEKTGDVMSEFAVQAARNIQSTLGDTLYDVLDGNFDDIGNSFAKMLKRMAAELAASAVLKFVGNGLASQGGIIGSIGTAITSGSFSTGGYTGGTSPNQVTGIVHGKEGVLNAKEVQKIGGEQGFKELRQSIAYGGNRAAGGNVSPGKFYRVNESGSPEILNTGGKQYLMTNKSSGSVSPANTSTAMSGGVEVYINIDSDGNTQTETPAGYQQFGKEVGQFVERKFYELVIDEQRPGGLFNKA